MRYVYVSILPIWLIGVAISFNLSFQIMGLRGGIMRSESNITVAEIMNVNINLFKTKKIRLPDETSQNICFPRMYSYLHN